MCFTSATTPSPAGEATLTPAIYEPVLAAMADHHVHSIGELWQRLQADDSKSSISFAQLTEAIMLRAGTGDVVAVQDAAVVQKAKPQTDKLNRHVLGMLEGKTPMNQRVPGQSGRTKNSGHRIR